MPDPTPYNQRHAHLFQNDFQKTPSTGEPFTFQRASEVPFGRYDKIFYDTDNEELYAQRQSAAEQLANGAAKMAGTFTTSFLEGTVGVVNGIGQMFSTGKFSSFYDNDLNRKLDDFNKYLEDALPNYYTHAEKDAEWYSPKNIFSANFLGDKVLKNLGYSFGALAGGVGWGALVKSIGLTNRLVRAGQGLRTVEAVETAMVNTPKVQQFGAINNTLNSLWQASKNTAGIALSNTERGIVSSMGMFGEATIEAYQASNEFRNKLIQDYKNLYGDAPKGDVLEEINSYADSVGSNVFGANAVLLTLTNYIQLPKILGSSKTLEKRMINNIEKEAGLPTGKFVAGTPSTGNVLSPIFNKLGKLGRAIDKFVLGPGRLAFSLGEAFEEGAQYAAQVGSEDYFERAYKNKEEVDSFIDGVGGTLGNIFTEGVRRALSDKEGLESILIGGISGGIQTIRGNIRERGLAGTGGIYGNNTALAINALNKTNLKQVLQDGVKYAGIAIESQKLRQGAIANDDTLAEKDYEKDYTLSYIMPRVKYGKVDSVFEEIGYYREQVMSNPSGFQELQGAQVVLPGETKERFLERLTEIEETAKEVNNFHSMLEDKYSAILSKDGKRVYNDEVIDRLTYSAARISDYDKRLAKLSGKLQMSGVEQTSAIVDAVTKSDGFVKGNLKETIADKTVKEIIDSAGISITEKDLLEPDEKIKDVVDLVRMLVNKQSFVNDYTTLKAYPEQYKPIAPPAAPPPPEEEEPITGEKVKIKTATGEKEYEVGQKYFVGKGVDYEKEGLDAPVKVSSLTILGENEDGTLRIRDNKGEERNISKDTLQDYKLSKESTLLSNKTANYFYNHRNEVFIYNFGKALGGEKPGRIEYDNGKLFFVYLDGKGKIKRKELNNSHFVAQEGFTQGRIRRAGGIQTSEQEQATQEFTSEEEIAKQKKTLAESKLERIKIINEIESETRSRINDVTEKLEKKKEQLKNISEKIEEVKKEVKGVESRKRGEKVTQPEKKKARFSKIFSTTSKAISDLSNMRSDIEKEIDDLVSEKDELELTLSYLQDFSQNITELPEDRGEFLKELKDQIEWVDNLVSSAEKSISTLNDVKKAIEKAVIEFAALLNDSLTKFDKDYPGIIKRKIFEIQEGNFIVKDIKELKEYLADYAIIKNLQEDISVNEKKLDDTIKQLDALNEELSNLEARREAQKKILDRFQAISDAYEAMVEEEDKILSDENLKSQLLATDQVGVQTVDFDESNVGEEKSYEQFDKKYRESPKKSASILPRATSGVMRGKPHQVRANAFGFNLDRFPNRSQVRGVYVTSKTEDQLIPGLTDFLRKNEVGQINEDINKDEIIALVMVQEIDGELKLLGVDGKPIPEDADKLENAIFQVFPDNGLKWGNEYDNESMFRKETPEEVKNSIIEQYGNWRTSILARTAIGQPHKVGASFGFLEEVKDADGKTNYQTRTAVEDANLIDAGDLEVSPLIRIPTLISVSPNLSVESKGTVTIKVPIGTPLLEVPNGLVKLQNRRHTEEEANTIHQAILQLAKYMIDPNVGINDAKSKRLLNWLKSVVYWGVPKDQDGNRKPAGYNSVFFEKDPDTGKLMLTLSKKGKDFRFTPSSIEMEKASIVQMLTSMYNNVNNNMAKDINEPYEEILSVSKDGEVTSRIWKNYQSYLLSSKTPDGSTRTSEQLPLSTIAKPVVSKDEVNRKGIYFYTTDTVDDFVIPVVVKEEAPKVIIPGRPISRKTPSPSPAVSEIEKAVLTEENYNAWSNVKDKSDYQAFVDQVRSTIAMFDNVPDPSLITPESVDDVLKDVKAFANKAIRDKVIPLIVAKYTTKPSEQLPSFETEAVVIGAPQPPSTPQAQGYTLDGETINIYTSKQGKKIYFVASENTNEENYDKEILVMSELGDAAEVVKTLDDSGKDGKTIVKKTIFNEIVPILESFRAIQEQVVVIGPEIAPAVEAAELNSGNQVDQSVIDILKKAAETLTDEEEDVLREVINQEVKPFEPENWNKVETWLKAKFPNIPVYRVKNIIRATNGKQAWGMFKDGAIYIYENAEVGTAYHEVFHAVWRMMTGLDEQKAVIAEMRSRSGKFFDRESLSNISYAEATDKQLEEKLAEEFRDYVQFKKAPTKPEKGKSFIAKLFSDLVDIIKEFFLGPQSDSKVEEMFSKIEKGYYKSYIPFESNLSFAKAGVINIEDAFANEEAALSAANGITDRQMSDIIQEMTYLTFLDIAKTDQSFFEIQKKNKKELYKSLKENLQLTIAKQAATAQKRVENGEKTQAEMNPIISSTIQLLTNVQSNWDTIVKKHQEYLRSYSIEFDENDDINLTDENNSGRETYQDATKIDSFKKASGAIKFLLATVAKVKLNSQGKVVFERSSIGGRMLVPISQTYISMMNNLHTSKNIEEMMERLRDMAASDIKYRAVYERITKRDWSEGGVDFSKIETQHGLQLIGAIWNTFKKQSPEVKNVFILDNGDVVVGEANLSTAAQQVKRGYINAIVTKAREGKGYFKYEKNVYKGDTVKAANVKLDNTDAMVDFLKNMGIVFTKSEVDSKMSDSQKKTFELAVKGIRESIVKSEEIATFSGKSLNMDKRLMELSLVRAALDNPEFSSTYFNISGEKAQTHIGTNAASNLAEFLGSLKNFNKESVEDTPFKYLYTDSFAQNSNLVQRMFASNGERKTGADDLFKIGIAGGTSNKPKGKEKESSKLTYKERLSQEINLNLQGWYLNLVPGDASIEWMIQLGNAISMDSLNRGMGEVENIFKGYFLSELELVRENRPVAKNRDAKEMRFFKGILGETVHNKVVNAEGSVNDVYEKFKNDINEKLKSFIEKDVNNFKSVLIQYGIMKMSAEGVMFEGVAIPNGISMKDADSHLTLLSINYMISNIEMHKLLYSDPYQYEDELKRIKSFNSPRQAIIGGSRKMNQAFDRIWNKEYESEDIGRTNFIRDYFRSVTHKDTIGVIDIPGYKGFKETDGGGIITMKAYRNFRLRAGNWNSDEERQYRYDIAWEKRDRSKGLNDEQIKKAGLTLSKKEMDLLAAGNPGIKSAYTPLKPIVSGSKLDEYGKPSSYNDVVLDKFALYPLSYRIMKEMDENSNALKLYEKMQKEDIDYMVFDSGRKVGAKGSHATYDENGNFNNTPYKAVVNIPFSIMSVQTEVPSKDDNLVTRGSQVTKLITLDFMQAGVPIDFFPSDDFNKRYKAWYKLSEKEREERSKLYKEIKENGNVLKALTELGYKNTLERLGIKETVYKNKAGEVERKFEIVDRSKVVTTLREEILKRESNDNIIAALDGFLNGKVVLEATPAYQQIRNILYSIADKEFLRPKISGGMKVQIPSTFFESGNRKVKDGLYESDVLKFYEKDGKRVAEVMLGRWFDSPLSDEELLKYLNETEEGQRILSGVGYRIPTQKQNSIDAIVIKKFLPKEFGDSVVIPAALVQKVGSDFDIDKLSVYLKNVYIKDGKPKLIPYFGIGQQAIDKFTDLYNKGEFLTEEEMKELDRYIAEEQIKLQEISEDSPEGKLMSSIFGKLFSEEEITEEFTKSIRSREQMINKLYKKSLENAYIQSMETLISHPRNYDNLIKPNSADPLKDLAKEIALKTVGGTFDYTKVENMLDRTFMSRLRHAFVRGKYAIGIAAVNQTNHSLNQRQPIYIDKDRMSLLSKDDLFWLGDGEVRFSQYNTIEIDGKMRPTLSMIINKAGESISDIIGMFIDGYVDISKGPWIMELGATPNVASTWLFLVKIGVPIKSVAYFMNQPIVRDYLASIENAGYSWLFIDSFVENVSEKYGGAIAKEEMDRMLSDFTIPNQTILQKNVGKPIEEMTSEEKIQQQLILKEFLKYAKMAEQMFHFTQGSNYDTANFNDPYLVFKKHMQYLKAKNGIISSVDGLLKNSIVGDMKAYITEVRDAFANILMSDSKNVRNVIEKVLEPYVNESDRDFVKIAQKAVNDLFDWAVQVDQGLNDKIKDILINDGGVGREVVTLLNQVASNPNHPLRGNHVIEIIESIPSMKARTGGVNNVELKTKDNKVYDQNNIIYAFRELRDYLKGENNPLYQRLKVLAVLQSGLSSSQISFTSLLPYEDFEDIYNKTLIKLESMNLDKFYELGVFQRNNWNNDDFVPWMRAKYIKTDYGPVYNPAMNFFSKNVKKAVSGKVIPPVISISLNNREANSDYIVYSWEKDFELLTEEETELDDMTKVSIIKKRKADMRKRGDLSFMQKGLFKKVKDNDNKQPFVYISKTGKEYFIYKAINAWGDGYRANEFWDVDHKSVIENDFVKVEDTNDSVVVSVFSEEETVALKEAPVSKEAPSGKIGIVMSGPNSKKIEDGVKTTTTRSDKQAEAIAIPIGSTAIRYINNKPYNVTNRGLLSIAEAGGKQAMLKSEGVASEAEFEYQQTKDWVNGKGKLYVYDIAPLTAPSPTAPTPVSGVEVETPPSAEPTTPPALEIGRYVKYNNETYIVTQVNDNGTVQIYNPKLEGAAAKISVSSKNLTPLESKAVVVEHKDAKYLVTPKDSIISLTTNKIMKWTEENGDRKAILQKAGRKEKVEALPFTFTPGEFPILDARSTIINYTDGQKKALLDVQQRIDSNTLQYYLLAGFAGTGKTTIAENIVRYALMKDKSPYVIAPTNKAAKVLKDKLDAAGLFVQASTIHKTIYGEPDPTTGEWILGKELKNSVIIVDESSMISKELMNDFLQATSNNNVVVFMGDSFQLEPVGEDSGLFKGKVAEVGDNKTELTEVKRQSLDSNILKIATIVRTEQVPYIPEKSLPDFKVAKSKAEFVNDFRQSIKNNEDSVMIVATNSERIQMNNVARQEKFGAQKALLNKGDVMISVANSNEYPNSDIFKVKDFSAAEKKTITLTTPDGKTSSYDLFFVDAVSEEGRRFTMAHAPVLDRPSLYHGQLMSYALKDRNFYDYLWSKGLIEVKKGGRQKVSANLVIATYGYSVTAHKSQGSQWKKVFVNQNFSSPNWSAARWYYTAITRSSKDVVVLNSGYNISLKEEDMNKKIDDIATGKIVPLKNGEVVDDSEINSRMLEQRGYTQEEIGELFKTFIC